MKAEKFRQLDEKSLESRLQGARDELMKLKAQLASGGSIDNPSKIKILKQDIARILTIQNEKH